jgi:hypothetical protein
MMRATSVGYGPPALDALEQAVTELKKHDPMAPVVIVVPNDITGIVARRRLAHGVGGRPGIAALTVTTLPRLAESLVSGRLAGRRPATPAVVAAAWRNALAVSPGRFEAVAEHAATVRALVRAHRELRDLSDTELAVIAESGSLAADAVRLYSNVRVRLAARYDDADAISLAIELLDTAAATVPPTLFYIPQQWTNRETALAAALGRHGEVGAIVARSGNDRADAGVLKALKAAGIEPVGAAPEPSLATTVFNASDSDDEVRWIARRVLRQLESTPAHRIAVLYGAASPYARLLHEHLGAAGIKVNGPGVVAVRDRSVARGFLAVLRLPANRFARTELFATLGQAPIRTESGKRVPVARWERASRAAGVIQGDDWNSRLDASAVELGTARERALEEKNETQADYLETSIADIRALQSFVADLAERLEAGAAAASWSELSQWGMALLRDYLGTPEDLVGRLPPAEIYSLATVESSLRALSELDEFEASADLATMVAVIDADLEAARPRVGRFGEGVFVGPLSAAPGLDVDAVLTVGLSEDCFPGRVIPDALLPDDVRSLVEGRLPLAQEHIVERHRHLLAAFAGAPTVIASFARGDLRRSAGRLPSRWLLPSIRHLADAPDLLVTEWETARGPQLLDASSFWNEIRKTSDAATETEWRLRAVASGITLQEPAADSALALIEARESEFFTRFDGDLRHISGLPDYARNQVPVAPTTLEGYAICPHAYLVERLLRVKAVKQPEELITISPLNSGNLVHEAFDTFFRQLTDAPDYGEPWTAQHKVKLRAIANEIGDRFVAAGLTGHPKLWSRDLAAILLDLDAMLDDDSAERARPERDARVLQTELRFGQAGEDAVHVTVDSGVVHMSGSIDKIDEQRDGRLVVEDIKTGKALSFRGIPADVVVAGTKLQLPAYALAARQALAVDDIEALYWFVRRDAGTRIPVTLDAVTEQVYSTTVGTLVDSIATGLFPAKPPEDPDHFFVQCDYCNPDGIGHAEARVRYETKRLDPALATLTALIDPGATA